MEKGGLDPVFFTNKGAPIKVEEPVLIGQESSQKKWAKEMLSVHGDLGKSTTHTLLYLSLATNKQANKSTLFLS